MEEEKIPLDPNNKVYEIKDLVPKFVYKIDDWFRKIKIKSYKRKKIKQSKTRYYRMYHIKFQVLLEDDLNPYEVEHEFEMIVPARAAYFAKKNLEKSIKDKITVKVNEIEEMSEKEFNQFKKTKDDYLTKNLE